MIIAIGSEGKTSDDLVSEICGRAKYFQIYENKKLIQIIENPFKIGGGGAGVGVAKMLIDKGAELIICGKLGDNMIEWLNDKKVSYKELKGMPIKEVLE